MRRPLRGALPAPASRPGVRGRRRWQGVARVYQRPPAHVEWSMPNDYYDPPYTACVGNFFIIGDPTLVARIARCR